MGEFGKSRLSIRQKELSYKKEDHSVFCQDFGKKSKNITHQKHILNLIFCNSFITFTPLHLNHTQNPYGKTKNNRNHQNKISRHL